MSSNKSKRVICIRNGGNRDEVGRDEAGPGGETKVGRDNAGTGGQ